MDMPFGNVSPPGVENAILAPNFSWSEDDLSTNLFHACLFRWEVSCDLLSVMFIFGVQGPPLVTSPGELDALGCTAI